MPASRDPADKTRISEHIVPADEKTGFVPEQTQDFYPTPGTMSTVMYHTGLDPRSMKSVFTAKGEKQRRLQRALLQFDRREKRKLVIEALKEAGREDLIGSGRERLVNGSVVNRKGKRL